VNSSMALRRSQRGFTLVELMLVLLIMGTLSTMILPSIATSLRSKNIDATTTKIHELLNFAYLSAISRHRPVVVNLDAERRRCWVTVRTVSLPWLEQHEEKPDTRTLATIELPEGTDVVVTREQTSSFADLPSQLWETIVFRSDGSSENVIIELGNDSGEVRVIEIIGITGEVLIKEEDELT